MAEGISQFGNIIGAFSPPKLKKIFKSDALQGQIDKSIGGLDDYRSNISGGLDAYAKAMDENVAGQRRYGKMAESELGQVSDEVLRGDYMADRERIRSGDLGSLQSLLGNIGGGMSASDKMASARLGYAGRPSGGYQDKARQAYLGAFAGPIAQQIFSGLDVGAGGADAARRGKAGTVAGIIGEREKIGDRVSDRVLAPSEARSAFLGQEISALSGLGGAVDQNLYGMKEEKNKWAALGDAVDSGVNSTIDTGMSLYGLGGFGGFGGGGKGGAGGTGGAAPGFFGKIFQQRDNYQPMNYPAFNAMPGYAPQPFTYQPQTNWSFSSPWGGVSAPSMRHGMPGQGWGTPTQIANTPLFTPLE